MGGKNPLTDAGNAFNREMSNASNSVNRELSNAGNATNEFVARSSGVKGFVNGGSNDPIGQASGGMRQGQINEQNVEGIRSTQKKLIDDYEKNAGQYKSGFLDIASKDARKNLAEQMLDNKRKTHAQGFINYGLRDLNNSLAQAETKSSLAQKEYDINKTIDDQIAEMRNSYVQSGIDYANLGQQQQLESYKQALENIQRQSAATRDLLTTGGQLAGTIAAQNKKT